MVKVMVMVIVSYSDGGDDGNGDCVGLNDGKGDGNGDCVIQ